MEELGGANLYQMVGNDMVNDLDVLGMWSPEQLLLWKLLTDMAVVEEEISVISKQITTLRKSINYGKCGSVLKGIYTEEWNRLIKKRTLLYARRTALASKIAKARLLASAAAVAATAYVGWESGIALNEGLGLDDPLDEPDEDNVEADSWNDHFGQGVYDTYQGFFDLIN